MELNAYNLENAYNTLLKCYKDYKENKTSPLAEYIEDSCIKRFEYTLETAWKLMKKILIKEYGTDEEKLSINNIFRLMQGYLFIQDWQKWRDYYKHRNATAHEYNIEKSRELIEIIPNFISDVEFFINKFKEKCNE